MLRLYGALANEGASLVMPLLLPDAPVVAWWPFEAPASPSKDPIGAARAAPHHRRGRREEPDQGARARRKAHYAPGDTDLAWTRLTLWRALLAAALDLPPYEKVTGADVTGEADSPSTDLLAAWLRDRLKVTVKRFKATSGQGIVPVRLDRTSGDVELLPPGRQGRHADPARPAGPAGRAAAARGARLPRRGAAPARPGRGLRSRR